MIFFEHEFQKSMVLMTGTTTSSPTCTVVVQFAESQLLVTCDPEYLKLFLAITYANTCAVCHWSFAQLGDRVSFRLPQHCVPQNRIS